MAGRCLVINVVGLTPAGLDHAPRLRSLAEEGGHLPLVPPLPAVTCTAQATMLTGLPPDRHGVVGNGWFWPELDQVLFWRQPHGLLGAAAPWQGRPIRAASLFWGFNLNSTADIWVTPRPSYGADGAKRFGIQSGPPGLAAHLEERLGPFPFASFWGPRAGLSSTGWIAGAASAVLDGPNSPDLLLAYLPHLDYDFQRFGPGHADAQDRIREVDDVAGALAEKARSEGYAVLVVSEYGLEDVNRAVLPNLALREAGLLEVRETPFGEVLEPGASRAFCVCDHQIAHVHLHEDQAEGPVREILESLPGVADFVAGADRAGIGLDHPRAGHAVLLAESGSWFAYPYWLVDADAPDFARTVDIHRKPGYDPCELFLDPTLTAPRLRVARRLLASRLGFRTLFDVIPLDPSLVRGSHGLPPVDPSRGPVVLASEPGLLPEQANVLQMGRVRDLMISATS